MSEKWPCPKCGSLNAPESLYCDQCGVRLSPGQTQTADFSPGQDCPHCGVNNPVEANRCVQCGANIRPAARPPHVAQSTPPPSLFAARIDKLGNRLDGWADLIDNAADKAEAVRSAFQADLEQRKMPQVERSRPTLTTGGVLGKRRNYYVARSYTGASLAVYVGGFGRDLYVSWDLFVRPHIKWRNILIMLGIAAVLAIFPAANSYSEFSAWITATITGFFGIAMVALILGKVLRGSAKAFFMEEIDRFAADDVTATMFAVHHGLLKSIDAAGLDSSVLREKETFKAGRRERII